MKQIDQKIADKVEQRTKDKSTNEKLALWLKIKGQLQVGDHLQGIIYYRAPYGVWLDVDLDYPALLRLPDMTTLDYQRYLNNDCYELGEKLPLSYVGMNENPDKILVSEWIDVL